MFPCTLVLAVLLATPPTTTERCIEAAVAYAGRWYPERNESAKLKSAEKACGSLFSRPKAGSPPKKSLRPGAAKCRLPRLDLTTVSAFNAQPLAYEVGWQLRPAPNGLDASLDGAGTTMVGLGLPVFNESGKQALILVNVSPHLSIFGHPEAMKSFDLLLLMERGDDGDWSVSQHALVNEEWLN